MPNDLSINNSYEQATEASLHNMHFFPAPILLQGIILRFELKHSAVAMKRHGVH